MCDLPNPECNVRPEVVGTLQAACQVEEFLIVVTSFVYHSPEVSSIIILTTFCPFLVTESCADSSDECTVREGIKPSCVSVEHQAIEASFKLFWSEEILLDFVHPVPFRQDTGNAFVLAIILPVSGLFLFFNTAQTETMYGVFRLQTNNLIVEESISLECFKSIPIVIGHRCRIKKSIGTSTFNMNRNFWQIRIF